MTIRKGGIPKVGITILTAAISLIDPDHRKRSGLNFPGMVCLGYIYFVENGEMTCTECGYSFRVQDGYFLDDHLMKNSACLIAYKGGFTLNPLSQSSSQIHGAQIGIHSASRTQGTLDFCAVLTKSSEINRLNSNDLVFIGPKEEKDAVTIYSEMLSDTDETLDSYVISSNREESLKSSFCASLVKILACLGFYCSSENEIMIQCFFCKFQTPFNSLRLLFVSHKLFSPNCETSIFASLEEPPTNDYNTLAVRLYSNLKTFGLRWSYGEEMAFKSAIAGFKYVNKTDCLCCPDCYVDIPARELNSFSYSSLHQSHKATCIQIKSVSEDKTLHGGNDETVSNIIQELLEQCGSFLMNTSDNENILQSNMLHIYQESFISTPYSLKQWQNIYETLQNNSDTYHNQNERNLDFNRKILSNLTSKERLMTSNVMLSSEGQLGVTCSVCLEQAVECLFSNCGHACTCNECVMKVASCPICRSRIGGVLPVRVKVL